MVYNAYDFKNDLYNGFPHLKSSKFQRELAASDTCVSQVDAGGLTNLYLRTTNWTRQATMAASKAVLCLLFGLLVVLLGTRTTEAKGVWTFSSFL